MGIDASELNTHPTLSVILATTQPWPEARICLDSLRDQARAVQAEIIVADGSGRERPDDARFPDVIWLAAPGASVFALRALAMARARGEIIAVTEDHCRLRPDWCEQILRAHQEHPDAAAIGGVVENGATKRLMDWASFLFTNGAFMSPIQTGEVNWVSLQANISYKRRVIPKSFPEVGIVEAVFNARLHAQGERFVADDRIIVEHVQSLGFFGTLAIHFHNGRSTAGSQVLGMGWRRRLSHLRWHFRSPFAIFRGTVSVLRKKGRFRGRLFASMPLIAILICCHEAGEFSGFLLGPGKSPQRLR